jgi:hypothetical protein
MAKAISTGPVVRIYFVLLSTCTEQQLMTGDRADLIDTERHNELLDDC